MGAERAPPTTMTFSRTFKTNDLSSLHSWNGELQVSKRLTKREKKELKRKREAAKPRRNSR